MATKKVRKKVGLALGSGGIRGLAHVGVIRSLLDNNIPIDYIAGCSIGAWVAAHYALYNDLEKLSEFTVGKKQEKLRSFLEISLEGGLIKGKKLETLLDDWLDHKTFADIKTPLKVNAVDVLTGREIIFDSGSLGHAVRTSMSIPGIFRPIKENGMMLVDGGICNPVPDNIVREMGADVVISVNLDDFRSEKPYAESDMSITGITARMIEIMRHYLALNSLQSSDVIIMPPVAKYSNWREYFWNNAGEDIARVGVETTEKLIPTIRNLIAS